MESLNLVTALYRMAASQPDALAIAIPAAPGKPLPATGPVPYHRISYAQMALEVNSIARGLLASGFKQGDRVVLMVPPGFDFFIISFAFLQCGIVPVLIDPGIGTRNLRKCINETKPIGFIGITKAHLARVLLRWGSSTITRKVTLGPRLFWGGPTLSNIRKAGRSDEPPTWFEPSPDDLSGIFFTSGSTGISKGVVYTHGNMRQQVRIISDTFGLGAGEIDLPTFLPFALFNPTAGMTTIIPDMDPTRPAHVEPERIIRALQQFGVTNMFGSPALIDRVGRYAEAHKISIPTLRRVLSAGAPVPARSLRRFAAMLTPGIQLFTPYGATECMPVATIGSDVLLSDAVQQRTAKGAGICIGKPVRGIEVRIIRITDTPVPHWTQDLEVPTGVVGEIAVKGGNVTREYFNREEATRLAKISDGDGFWHRMGDLGYTDAEGYLWFCGRKSHRVQLTHRELYSVQCECIFNTHPQVYRTALVGVKNEAVLCVEVDRDAQRVDEQKLKEELLHMAASHELTHDIRTLLFHPSFPVDIRHNAKIIREKLAVWAATQLNAR